MTIPIIHRDVADRTTGATPDRTAAPRISPAELRRLALDGDEIAVVDVREGERYPKGHISIAVELPFSEIEMKVAALLPRRGVRIVVTDDAEELAPQAAARLRALGYTDVRILKGGLRTWADEGNELITGMHSLSKALGEFVERHDHTPKISAVELHAKLNSGEPIVVLDTRPLDEFNFIAIPGGVAAPGAELLYRAFDAVPSPTTPVVVNCAGRTRAIIGAQALRNAGFPNPVVSLENGTAAWMLAGHSPARGATQQAAPPSEAGLASGRLAAVRVAERFGVRTIDLARLATFREEVEQHSLYLLDVRTREEFEAGHVPGSRSAPGGQVVQTTDRFLGTRQGRVVLIDDPDLVRATITASWLLQLGLENVFVYPASAAERSERGTVQPEILGDLDTADTVSAAALDSLLADGAVVIDLEGAPPYYRERRYIPGSFVGRRSTLARHLDRLPGTGPIVLTSADGALARLAAGELAGQSQRRVVALAGGTADWIAAGHPVQTGLDQPALDPTEVLPAPQTLDEKRTYLAAYVAWGDVIVEQLERDGLTRFRSFPALP